MSKAKFDWDTLFEQSFPAPSPRENQKESIVAACKMLTEGGKDVVLLDAPPGFGKSITLYTIMDIMGGDWFYATPLKTLQDQLSEDEFIGHDIEQIKGRSNYSCIHPAAGPGTTVDKGPCQKDSTFECEIKEQCPYYKQKYTAMGHNKALMNLSYLMAEGQIDAASGESFGKRFGMIIDEVQGLEDWALSFVSLTVSRYGMPKEIWKKVDMPGKSKEEDVPYIAEWLKDSVLPEVNQFVEQLSVKANRTDKEMDKLEQMMRFQGKIKRFLKDYENNEWVATAQSHVRKNKPNYKTIELKPVIVARYMDDLIWSRADKFILSSATIPGNNWLKEIGLGHKEKGDKIGRISIGSPFPIENRPVIGNHAVGKMTKDEREKNILPAVKKVKQIADHHSGEKGFVHCRGYNYIKMFRLAAYNNGLREWYDESVMEQDRSDREGSLEEWVNNDKQIFLSVNMAEGIDLKYDKCRWQILLKTLYPHMGDKRVRKRVLDMGDWDWYNQKAATQIEQAYGRGVRAKDDDCIFYILDSSAIKLMQMNAEIFHKWFLEGVSDVPVNPERGI